ncbi:hypothetical protein SEA_PINKYOSHI_40 [Mycobacterium phage PinkYoshi]|uniref:Uncharacterized protein n=5 Tax=Liefievirus TaxID=1623288 RepID=Q1A0N9_9CAUD|nr:hypothetical protein ANGEL_40 [Mycobacterium phage Angel]YP_010051450.1 hypothetical protein KDW72_gp40 [Mycobacterium phage Grizzly]YP_655557.1 hypothetical protein Halo40 [Mycobacterium phage Halo]ACB58199.1 hypothetical protein BPs1_40 [Mycobacterium phage BPs]ACU41504.1 hypothetical protein HOPE_40 [Mycobacterium phage Hope]AER48495.1 hypothetical protein AVRAFAN_40 [Mycobacterium phage Avrafan]AJK27308.1 hypothetical protein PBI_GOMASHI_40 [Mycobacterium phage Gomashi]AKY02644.1 hypo
MAANMARAGSDGRPWPGFTVRFCPVCSAETGTHREPVDDHRGELVVYHDHDEPATGVRCRMAGERAAIRAVAFSTTDTGASPRTTAGRNLHRPAGSRAVDELLERLIEQETHAIRN